MKLAVLHVLFSSALGLAVCLPLSRGLAADTNAAPATTSASDTSAQAAEPAAAQPAPAKLPYGVEDILKLSSSQVSEGIILTYIQNSGTIYSLSPQDIATLKSAGVSDNVVMAMVDQRRNVMAAAAQAAPPAAAQPAPVVHGHVCRPRPDVCPTGGTGDVCSAGSGSGPRVCGAVCRSHGVDALHHSVAFGAPGVLWATVLGGVYGLQLLRGRPGVLPGSGLVWDAVGLAPVVGPLPCIAGWRLAETAARLRGGCYPSGAV